MILFGIPGPTSLIIVLIIILLLFGNRLPATMRSLGRGVTEFKKGLGGEGDDDDEPKPESEPKKVKQAE